MDKTCLKSPLLTCLIDGACMSHAQAVMLKPHVASSHTLHASFAYPFIARTQVLLRIGRLHDIRMYVRGLVD